MDWLSEEEECVLVNAREMSPLWALLADWTESEDQGEWMHFEPVFAEIVERWSALDYVDVYIGPAWPAHESGYRARKEDVPGILSDHGSWQYPERPGRVISLLPGERSGEIYSPDTYRGGARRRGA